MKKTTLLGLLLVSGASLLSPSLARAQMQSWRDVQVADLETMKDKFVSLGGAFTEEQWDWRPMEGVRSVKDVLALMIAETNMFPVSWGYDPPGSAASGFGPEMQRVGELSRAEILRELPPAFDRLIEIVRGMDEQKRASQTTMFRREMPVHAAVATAAADMHEHLGQLIAYARANEVVPPWSR